MNKTQNQNSAYRPRGEYSHFSAGNQGSFFNTLQQPSPKMTYGHPDSFASQGGSQGRETSQNRSQEVDRLESFLKTNMEKEFFFTKIELQVEEPQKPPPASQRGRRQQRAPKPKMVSKQAYAFVDFHDHPIDKKEEFEVGALTLAVVDSSSTSAVPQIYRGELMSRLCFNTAIEWNRSYFQKIRMGFYRRMKDVHFKLIEKQVNDEDDFLLDQPTVANDEGSAHFMMHFKVQNQTDVLAFQCPGLQLIQNMASIHTYQDAMDLVLAKVSEHCRVKNKEIEKVAAQRDLAIAQKQEVMAHLDSLARENSAREQVLLNKFVLLLNEKKKQIKELQEYIDRRDLSRPTSARQSKELPIPNFGARLSQLANEEDSRPVLPSMKPLERRESITNIFGFEIGGQSEGPPASGQSSLVPSRDVSKQKNETMRFMMPQSELQSQYSQTSIKSDTSKATKPRKRQPAKRRDGSRSTEKAASSFKAPSRSRTRRMFDQSPEASSEESQDQIVEKKAKPSKNPKPKKDFSIIQEEKEGHSEHSDLPSVPLPAFGERLEEAKESWPAHESVDEEPRNLFKSRLKDQRKKKSKLLVKKDTLSQLFSDDDSV